MPSGGSRPGAGRPKGRQSAATVERARVQAKAIQSSFGELTEEQIQSLLPRDILRLCAHAAVRLKDPELARKAAADWAPYEHPKLTSTTVDDKRRRSVTEYTDEELLALASPDVGGDGIAEAPARPH